MSDFQNQKFVCIDCETTGLDPQQDRIIEFAIICFDMQETFFEMQTLINPECEIPESSIAIHHITPNMVHNQPLISHMLPEILKKIGDHIIIGHGVGFDIDIIAHAAERYGIPCNLKKNKVIDTLRLARLYGESPINSLEHLGKHFNIPQEGPHRAMSDVIVNLEVFKKLARRYKSANHIFEVLSKPIFMSHMPLGKHKGRALKEIPLQYLQWISHKDFDQDLLYSVRSEIKRRKRGNVFGQTDNPFQSL